MAQTATVQIEMPEMGESVTEGIVLEWHVAEGDFVNEGDTVVEISTDKVDAEVPAPVAGVITKLLASVDDEVPVGCPLAEMEPGEGEGSGEGSNGSLRVLTRLRGGLRAGAGPPFSAPPHPRHPQKRPLEQQQGPRSMAIPKTSRATPVARRVAAELGVDLGGIAGSGPGTQGDQGRCDRGGQWRGSPGRTGDRWGGEGFAGAGGGDCARL